MRAPLFEKKKSNPGPGHSYSHTHRTRIPKYEVYDAELFAILISELLVYSEGIRSRD